MADPGLPQPLELEASIVEAGFTAARAELGRFNLAVFGLTGAGKSTLVNAVFGAQLAQTGIGEPVTQGSRLYRHDSSQLGIFDTKGLEIGSDNVEILRELRAFIRGNRMGALADQIHVIWYCIRAGDRRIQPSEQRFIEQVAALGIPVLLVMTQTPLAPDGSPHRDAQVLKAEIAAVGLPIWGPVHCINALGDDFDGIAPFGLEPLLAATAQAAPEGVRSALASAQVISAGQKKLQAQQRIRAVEQRLQRQVLFPDVGRAWSELFAEIAAIYQLPEADARAVLERVRAAAHLRDLVRRADTGLIVLAASALTAVGFRIDGIAPRRDGAPEPAQAATHDEWQDIPIALGADVRAADDPGAQRIGQVLAAAPVTAALGDAWRETCEYYWAQSFPAAPAGVDPQEMADRFAAELFDRLPQRLQKWEQRQQRKQAEEESKPPLPPYPGSAPPPVKPDLRQRIAARLRRDR
jgi:predicted GTPase